MADRLTEIEQRLERATPAPWIMREESLGDEDVYFQVLPFPGSEFQRELLQTIVRDAGSDWSEEDKSNAIFAASAPTDISYLLGEVRRLRQETKPKPSTMCGCGHARHLHEYGAFGYNAASYCEKDGCECPMFAETL